MILSDISLFLKSKAPPIVYLKRIEQVLTRKHKLKFNQRKLEFEKGLQQKKYSVNWFTHLIPRWFEVFEKSDVHVNEKYNILEIGSFEGLSSSFLLETFANSNVTCVDTWTGADEHATIDMSKIESNFDFNTASCKDRLTKYKGTSFSFFETKDIYKEQYDIIYVDGSHYVDDVLVDALRCFSILKVGGIMIFDDYRWRGYERTEANPATAINTLIRLKSKYLEVVSVYSQLVIKKTNSENHDVVQAIL